MKKKSKETVMCPAVGERLKKVRKDLKIKVSEMAQGSGISQGHIYEFERGTYFPSTAYLWYLYENFQVSIDYIFSGWGKPFTCMQEKIENEFELGESDSEIKMLIYHMICDDHVMFAVLGFYEEYRADIAPMVEIYRKAREFEEHAGGHGDADCLSSSTVPMYRPLAFAV